MSLHSARRRKNHHAAVADLARKRTERVAALLSLRDHLAAAQASYEAHGLPGAVDLLTRVYEIESFIRAEAPRVYEDRWSGWVEADARLIHTPDEPNELCHICQMGTAPLRPAG